MSSAARGSSNLIAFYSGQIPVSHLRFIAEDVLTFDDIMLQLHFPNNELPRNCERHCYTKSLVIGRET